MPKIHRPSHSDTEKLTLNVGHVDLGRIDLLVQEGFYANRSDFIRTAIRNQLTAEGGSVSRAVERHTLDLGMRDISREELEAAERSGEELHIRIVGLARIAPDVTPELARAAIGSLTVLGTLQAPAEVKAALKDRIR